jgi:ribulose-phosphate 3-epimerase
MQIVPAILTDNVGDFQKKISQAEMFCNFAQIDVMDGEFVPSKSVGIDVLSSINTSLSLEFHLMVNNPLEYLDAAKKSGIKRVIFHYEIKEKLHRITIDRIRSLGIEVGIAINPQTGIKDVEHLFKDIDLLLIMAVNPGFYASPFIPEVLEKARILSNRKHNFLLALDGGVKKENILEIKHTGLDIVCVGSAIFKGDDVVGNYRALKEKIS